MHNYHTEWFYFHGHGDPIPGKVLIREMHNEDSDPFRTTAEEIISFCAAHTLGAVGETTTLRTTAFVILSDDQGISLEAMGAVQPNEALSLVVRLADLHEFAELATARHLELAAERTPTA